MENGIEKKLFTNDRSVIITTLRHVFSEKIIITAVNNGARTVIGAGIWPLGLNILLSNDAIDNDIKGKFFIAKTS